MTQTRYRFYREHKYVSYTLSNLEQLIAKSDFTNNTHLKIIKENLQNLIQLLNGHAEYEEQRIHELLRKKGSTVHHKIEMDHAQHKQIFEKLTQQLDEIIGHTDSDQRISLGYEFYLQYRCFVSDNLHHINQEELVIMPELHKLYGDNELQAIEFETYDHMTVTEIIHMLEILFPHINSNDKQAFLADIKAAQPEKLHQISNNQSLVEKLGANNESEL